MYKHYNLLTSFRYDSNYLPIKKKVYYFKKCNLIFLRFTVLSILLNITH